MPHADSAIVPSFVKNKKEFWALVGDQLDALLEPHTNWVVRHLCPACYPYNFSLTILG